VLMNSEIQTSTETSNDGRWIKVLSYNIQVGIPTQRYRDYLTNSWKHVLPYRGRQSNLENIGGFISDFDIVGLQEVDAGSLRTAFMNQTHFLAQTGGFPHWFERSNRKLGGISHHSMGLLSRYSSCDSREHRLPSRIPGRGALEVHIGHGENPLVIVILHLSLGRKDRMSQISYIADVVSSHRNVVVMGDMNCSPESAELIHLVEATGLQTALHQESTYPSWRPSQSFDHIFVSENLEVRDVRVYRRPYSDHLPVCAQVRIPNDVGLL